MSPSANRLPARRRLAAWALLWLFVLGTLAPGVSRALASRSVPVDAAPWAQLCQAGQPAGGQPADPLAHALDHCPLCALQALDLAPPPAPLPALAAWPVAEVPVACPAASAPVGAAERPPARAPPAA